jgi:hypothetical protein
MAPAGHCWTRLQMNGKCCSTADHCRTVLGSAGQSWPLHATPYWSLQVTASSEWPMQVTASHEWLMLGTSASHECMHCNCWPLLKRRVMQHNELLARMRMCHERAMPAIRQERAEKSGTNSVCMTVGGGGGIRRSVCVCAARARKQRMLSAL